MESKFEKFQKSFWNFKFQKVFKIFEILKFPKMAEPAPQVRKFPRPKGCYPVLPGKLPLYGNPFPPEGRKSVSLSWSDKFKIIKFN